jgi:hypothetical protein
MERLLNQHFRGIRDLTNIVLEYSHEPVKLPTPLSDAWWASLYKLGLPVQRKIFRVYEVCEYCRETRSLLVTEFESWEKYVISIRECNFCSDHVLVCGGCCAVSQCAECDSFDMCHMCFNGKSKNSRSLCAKCRAGKKETTGTLSSPPVLVVFNPK